MRQESRMVTLEIDLQLLCESVDKRDFFAIQEKIDFNHEVIACDLFGISIARLRAKTRKREVVKCRQLCMWYMKNKSPLSLAAIGSRYGGKDHATVLNACRMINDLIDSRDVVFHPLIEEFKKQTNYENTTFFQTKSTTKKAATSN